MTHLFISFLLSTSLSFSHHTCPCSCSGTMLCLTLCGPMDCSPPVSSVHGVSKARILEWVAIPFSRGIFPTQGSNLHLLHCQEDCSPLSHEGSPYMPLLLLKKDSTVLRPGNFMQDKARLVGQGVPGACVCIKLFP